MSITLLSKELIEKIAAGEVVERPSSVIKELIENSIDAGAKNITIEIEKGGISYIRISDNGSGMSEEDAKMCFFAHATSKISKEPDLFSISTLGFRGEALSSISAVSKVTLFTRTIGSEYALKLVNHGGTVISTEACGKPDGTTIVVEDLFYNVPARLKFLKKPSTESSYISAIIQKYILARPDISFRYICDGKDVYHSRGDDSLKNAIYTIYGKDVYSNLIAVDYLYDYIQISGFVGEPEISRGTRSFQNLFVNGRYIRSDIIANSVKQGYANRIMPAKHPVFILSLKVPLDSVDVNVHPNKLDVRFKDEGLIQECFFKAVRSAFEEERIKPEVEHIKQEAIPSIVPQYSIKESIKENIIKAAKEEIAFEYNPSPDTNMVSQFQSVLPRNEEYVQIPVVYKEQQTDTVVVKHPYIDTKEAKPTQTELQMNLSKEIGDYLIIGQLFNTYLLVEYKDSFLLIDQHAAHERLNTDMMLSELENSNILKQQLLIPAVVQLTAQDFTTVMESTEDFLSLGFELEEFGNSTIRINSVPHIFGEKNPESFFFETLDSIRKNPKMDTRKHIIFETACKHSIKAGQPLSKSEIGELIKRSFEDDSPLNCPHGRPIVIIKTKKEIEKWFMRIV